MRENLLQDMRSFPTGDVSSPLEMCIPALTSTSPAGDIASLARDVFASPNCGTCDTAENIYEN